MKKKMILALALTASSLSIGVYGSYAYLTAEEKTVNVITAGNLKIALIETSISSEGKRTDAPKEMKNIIPGGNISRIVQVENIGNNPAYIRIHIDKIISLEEGREEKADSDLVTYEVNTKRWIDGKDGYYYYRDSLEAGKRTEPLFEEVHFSASMENLYQNSTIRLAVKAQGTQVVHNGEDVMSAKGWPDNEK